MKPVLDDAFAVREEQNSLLARRTTPETDFNNPPRRVHPMLIAFFATGVATGGFYGAEMMAPLHWKPSYIIGGYERAMAEARKSGELTAEVRYQWQLKQIETAAVQWQEQYKATANGVLQYYQATYQRANVYAQATADVQKQYLAARNQLAVNMSAGDTYWTNLADIFAPVLGAIDPELGESAEAFAARKRLEALQKLDSVAQSGAVIKIDGWDSGLASPQQVANALEALPPLKLPSASATINTNR